MIIGELDSVVELQLFVREVSGLITGQGEFFQF